MEDITLRLQASLFMRTTALAESAVETVAAMRKRMNDKYKTLGSVYETHLTYGLHVRYKYPLRWGLHATRGPPT